MSIIIPYDDKLGFEDGAFIRPDGKILMVDGNKHEEYAEVYCNGKDYEILTGAKQGPARSILPKLEINKEIEELKKEKNPFLTSSLTKQQLELYKKWLRTHKKYHQAYYSDFLVYVLAYDKVETLIKRVITTTSLEPHIRFYNYYLMDWTINEQERLVYDEAKRKFIPHDLGFAVNDYNDREAEEEIEEIKAKVLLKERNIFFK